MIALVVFTHGRWDLLHRTMQSAKEHLHGDISTRLLMVDGEHPESATHMVDAALGWGDNWLIEWNGRRLGFGGTIARAWELLAKDYTQPFVLHLEDDFTFERDVDLRAMARVLSHRPDLAQMALRRQPVNDRERAAGGILEGLGAPFEMCSDFEGHHWMEHRAFWTTNPSLYRRDWCSLGWPDGAHSEGLWTHQLLADPLLQFGYWGRYPEPAWVTHIGEHRRDGEGY